MSWSGTVRCSNCYNSGHNRRSCPDLTAEALADYKHYTRLVEDHSDRYEDAERWIRRAEISKSVYIKRTGLDPDTGEKIKSAKSARLKSMRCGYCEQLGHTRRTCETIKRDFQVFVASSKIQREQELRKLQESGIGVGSLVMTNSWDGNNLRYVSSICWGECSAHRPSLACTHNDPKRLDRLGNAYYAHRVSVSKVAIDIQKHPDMCSLTAAAQPPSGWLSGDDLTLRQAFPSRGPKDDTIRSWGYKYPNDDSQEVIRDLGLEDHYNMS